VRQRTNTPSIRARRRGLREARPDQHRRHVTSNAAAGQSLGAAAAIGDGVWGAHAGGHGLGTPTRRLGGQEAGQEQERVARRAGVGCSEEAAF
jgi:hypothetical protein